MRTCLSWSGNTSSTQPRRHWPRGAFWSTTSTTSLTFRFFLASLHLFCTLSVDRYSSLQHFQNTLTRFWISLQWFLGLNAISSVAWGASCPPSLPCILFPNSPPPADHLWPSIGFVPELARGWHLHVGNGYGCLQQLIGWCEFSLARSWGVLYHKIVLLGPIALPTRNIPCSSTTGVRSFKWLCVLTS